MYTLAYMYTYDYLANSLVAVVVVVVVVVAAAAAAAASNGSVPGVRRIFTDDSDEMSNVERYLVSIHDTDFMRT